MPHPLPFPSSAPLCCGVNYRFRVRELACYAHPANNCQVKKDCRYFIYDDQYSVCNDCYRSNKLSVHTMDAGACIKIFPDQLEENEEALLLPKSDFKPEMNNKSQPEPLVRCGSCQRFFHVICVNYFPRQSEDYHILMGKKEDPDPDKFKFTCRNCGGEERKAPFRSTDIAPNCLSAFIENKLSAHHSHFKKDGFDINPVRIRCVSTNGANVFDVRPLMKGLYTETKHFPAQFPFKSKAVFAFQEQDDGSEVVIFGFHVNEYDHTCPEPNARRVYLSYLDSVSFFQPKELKTLTYNEIILAYFEYAKTLGFRYISIWSCPPSQADDYIFYAHPACMKIPKSKRLLLWYRRLLDTGVRKGTILSYTNAFRQASKDNMTILTQLPYYSGDHWPGQIEETIKKALDQMQEQKRSTSSSSVYAKPRRPPGQRMSQAAAQPKQSLHRQLNDDIMKQLKELREIFFTVTLVQPQDPVRSIVDPDPEIRCQLFDDRETFLTYCRANFCEFSNLRLATYSTSRFIEVVVRDHTKQHLKYYQTSLHVFQCLKRMKSSSSIRCDLPECVLMKKKLKNKSGNPILSNVLQTAGIAGQSFQDAFLLFTKYSLANHMITCQKGSQCEEERCRSAAHGNALGKMLEEMGRQK